MDQIKAKNVKAVDIADEFLKDNLVTASGKENGLEALNEWEMALVGGGDDLVCW